MKLAFIEPRSITLSVGSELMEHVIRWSWPSCASVVAFQPGLFSVGVLQVGHRDKEEPVRVQ